MITTSPCFSWRRSMAASDLASTTKLVLFVLAEYANAMDDVCWPSVEALAEKASLCARAVGKHLAIAEQAGWLARWKSRKKGRRWAHGHYRLSLPESVARAQRDVLGYDLAAGDEDFTPDSFPEPRSGNAQLLGIQEQDSAAGGLDVGFCSGDVAGKPHEVGDSESCRNHVPTNNPVNRYTSKPSLSQPTAVSEVMDVQRDDSDDSDFSMAQWMLDRLRVDDPGLPKPDLEAWAADIRVMRTVDGHQADQLAKLFLWTTRDRFWKRVISSPARLRKNWDEVRRRRNAELVAKSPTGGGTSCGGGDVASDHRCAYEVDGCRCAQRAAIITGAGASRKGFCLQHAGLYDD